MLDCVNKQCRAIQTPGWEKDASAVASLASASDKLATLHLEVSKRYRLLRCWSGALERAGARARLAERHRGGPFSANPRSPTFRESAGKRGRRGRPGRFPVFPSARRSANG